MTPWISARRADRFESLLRAGLEQGSETDPDGGSELHDLARLVTTLTQVEPPTPRPEFLAELRERLLVEAATTLQKCEPDVTDRLSLPERNPRRRRRLAAAITGVVLVGTGGTMAVAAQSALPGDGLYPIKILVEKAESSVTFSDAARGDRQLQHAQSRLDEVGGLLDDGSAGALGQLPNALSTFSSQSRSAADLLLADHRSRGDETQPLKLRAYVTRNLAFLDEIDPRIPAFAHEELVAAAQMLLRIDRDVSAACPSCQGEISTMPGLLQASPSMPAPVDPAPSKRTAPTPPPAASSNRPSAKPTGAVLQPTQQPSPDQTPGHQVPQVKPSSGPSSGGNSGGSAGSGSGSGQGEPKAPGKSPSKAPSGTSSGPVQDLVENLVGNGKSGEDANPGVVGGLVGGVLGGVGGLLGGLLGGSPSSTPTP